MGFRDAYHAFWAGPLKNARDEWLEASQEDYSLGNPAGFPGPSTPQESFAKTDGEFCDDWVSVDPLWNDTDGRQESQESQDESGGTNKVAVTFNVQAVTVPGENIYLTGGVDALQNWSPDAALLLSPANYPIWSITVNLPAGTLIPYKYIRKDDTSITWESDPNMHITTPSSGSLTENDTWR